MSAPVVADISLVKFLWTTGRPPVGATSKEADAALDALIDRARRFELIAALHLRPDSTHEVLDPLMECVRVAIKDELAVVHVTTDERLLDRMAERATVAVRGLLTREHR